MPAESETAPVVSNPIFKPHGVESPDLTHAVIETPAAAVTPADESFRMLGSIEPVETSPAPATYAVPQFPGYRFPVPAERVQVLDLMKTDRGPLQAAVLATARSGDATVVYAQGVDAAGRLCKREPIAVIVAAKDWCSAAE